MDLLADSAQAIKKAIEHPELVDMHILTSLEKIRSLEAELQGPKGKSNCLMTMKKGLGKHLMSSNHYLIYR